jgi:hypothetical protein
VSIDFISFKDNSKRYSKKALLRFRKKNRDKIVDKKQKAKEDVSSNAFNLLVVPPVLTGGLYIY